MNGLSILTRTLGLMSAAVLLMSCASAPPPPVIGEADVAASVGRGGPPQPSGGELREVGRIKDELR